MIITDDHIRQMLYRIGVVGLSAPLFLPGIDNDPVLRNQPNFKTEPPISRIARFIVQYRPHTAVVLKNGGVDDFLYKVGGVLAGKIAIVKNMIFPLTTHVVIRGISRECGVDRVAAYTDCWQTLDSEMVMKLHTAVVTSVRSGQSPKQIDLEQLSPYVCPALTPDMRRVGPYENYGDLVESGRLLFVRYSLRPLYIHVVV